MTDLQAHVEAPGRADLVKQVSEKIKETGVDYIYYQFISVTGRIVGKGIPADHWERTAERGFQLVYGSTANLFIAFNSPDGSRDDFFLSNYLKYPAGSWRKLPGSWRGRSPTDQNACSQPWTVQS